MLGCDTMSDEYKTLAEARSERLFERGWLPDILPPTANRIRTSNDLDVGTSKGEFYFDSKEHESFIIQLTPDTLNGDNCYKYSTNNRVWRFCCARDIGHCSFELPGVINGG